MNTNDYISEGSHLPEFMSDFHDQKDLFKAIYEQWNDGKHKVLEDVSWVDAHVFTIDYFLSWMGHHGYKLQKIRRRGVEFFDPIETIEKCNNIRRGKTSEMLKRVLP